MDRFATGAALGLMLAAAGLAGGCSGNGSGLLTTSSLGSAEAPGTLKNDDPATRPVAVGWTSARARRCGFNFDGPKLRATYLAWEAQQGATPEQLAKIERSYDTSYKTTWDKVAADEGYCTDKKGSEIKVDLQRHLAGDYTPKLPEPKVVASCGFFGCGSTEPDEPLDPKKFWAKKDAEKVGR